MCALSRPWQDTVWWPTNAAAQSSSHIVSWSAKGYMGGKEAQHGARTTKVVCRVRRPQPRPPKTQDPRRHHKHDNHKQALSVACCENRLGVCLGAAAARPRPAPYVFTSSRDEALFAAAAPRGVLLVRSPKPQATQFAQCPRAYLSGLNSKHRLGLTRSVS